MRQAFTLENRFLKFKREKISASPSVVEARAWSLAILARMSSLLSEGTAHHGRVRGTSSYSLQSKIAFRRAFVLGRGTYRSYCIHFIAALKQPSLIGADWQTGRCRTLDIGRETQSY